MVKNLVQRLIKAYREVDERTCRYKVTLIGRGNEYNYIVEAYDIYQAQDIALIKAYQEHNIYAAEWDEVTAIMRKKAYER
jgi:hypothetical protein